jgi:heme exporter protein CcmD
MNHAPFIWGAYGLSALILLWTAFSPVIQLARLKSNLRQLQSQENPDDTYT